MGTLLMWAKFVALGFVLMASASVLFSMKKAKTTGGGGAH
jgi:hypothetical protein